MDRGRRMFYYLSAGISGGSGVSSKKGFVIKEVVREGSWVATTFGERTSLGDQFFLI